MSNEKHYQLHPNATHPPIMTCEIPLEEYESLKRENAELKAKLEEKDEEIDKQKWRGDEWAKACNQKDKEIESLKASHYAESVDAGMENRKLKRALWLARAKRAIEKIAWFKLWNASISTMNPEDGARQEYDKWKKALGKFLAKAEQYK